MSKKNIIIGISLVIIIVIMFLLIYNIFFANNKTLTDKLDNDEKSLKSSSFFIKNKDKICALFDENGKQLTDFIFTDYANFYNGYSYVKNQDGKVGLINEEGKIIIDFNDYDSLKSTTYSDYVGIAKKNSKTILLDYKGKEVYTCEENQNIDSQDGIVYINNGKEFIIFSKYGVKLFTMPVVENAKKIKTKEKDNKVSVFYNNHNYIYNILNSSKIIDFESDYEYNGVYDLEETKYVLISSSDEKKSKVIENGKIVKELSSNGYIEGNFIIAGDKVYNTKLEELEKESIYYLGKSDYCIYNESEKEIKIYVNDLEVKSIKGSMKKTALPEKIYNYYPIKSDEYYAYYDKNGNKVSDNYYIAEYFDSYNNAIIKKSSGDKYFIINNKFEVISNEYSKITRPSDKTEVYYVGEIYDTQENSRRYYLIDYDGKQTQFFAEKNIVETLTKINNKEYLALKLSNKDNVKYGVYNYTDKKVMQETTDNVINKGVGAADRLPYYTLSNNDVEEFYLYKTGDKFFEK